MKKTNEPSTMMIPLVSTELPEEQRIIRLLTDKFPLFGKEDPNTWKDCAPPDVAWVLPARIPGLPQIVFIWPETVEELPDNVWWNYKDKEGELKEIYDNSKYCLIIETVFEGENTLAQWKLQLAAALSLSDDSPFVYDDNALKLINRIEADTILELPINPVIQEIYSFHAEYLEEHPDKLWLHTHGLSRFGIKDMDALGIAQDNVTMACGIFAMLADKQLNDPEFDPEHIIINEETSLKMLELEQTFAESEDLSMFGSLRDRDDFHIENRFLIIDQDNEEDPIFNLGKNEKRFSANSAISRIKNAKIIWLTKAEIERTKLLAEYRWPVFYSLFRLRKQYKWKFLIKISFNPEHDDSFSELLWFELLQIDEKILTAILVSEPLSIGNMQKGDILEVKQDMIQDWSISTDDGNYYPTNITELAMRAGVEVKSPTMIN